MYMCHVLMQNHLKRFTQASKQKLYGCQSMYYINIVQHIIMHS